jgi:3-isopropylmalate/(R)-2-methylmalate dehydratase large subunit
MTPAWVCFDYDPAAIAGNAYAGLFDGGERVFPARALRAGNFEVIVSGKRKRAPARAARPRRSARSVRRHPAGHRLVVRARSTPATTSISASSWVTTSCCAVQAGEAIPLRRLHRGPYDAITARSSSAAASSRSAPSSIAAQVTVPPTGTAAADDLAEKILAGKLAARPGRPREAGRRRAGQGRRRLQPRVHDRPGALLPQTSTAPATSLPNPTKFAVFEDHLIYADGVPSMAKFADKIQTLRDLQREFQAHTGVRDYGAERRLARHLPPGRARAVPRPRRLRAGHRQPHLHGRRIQRADLRRRRHRVRGPHLLRASPSSAVPESIRFELTGRLRRA